MRENDAICGVFRFNFSDFGVILQYGCGAIRFLGGSFRGDAIQGW